MAADTGRFGFVGVGNMGQALARGVASALGDGQRVILSDTRAEVLAEVAAALGAVAVPDNAALVAASDVILLCIKPQVLFSVLAPIAPVIRPDQLVISIAAGIPLQSLERALPSGTPVIRVMPNTPCLVGAGVSGYCLGTAATEAHAELCDGVLRGVGQAHRITEAQLDALTAVSGSGPAYAFHLMDAMIRGGVAAGLDEELARALAVHTVRGAGMLAAASADPPATLRQRVMSPGGTTEAAIRTMDAHGLQAAVVAGVIAARDRGIAMAAELG